MQLARLAFSIHPRRFGRGPAWIVSAPPRLASFVFSNELKLFATTFAGGFLFVSLLIA